MSGKYCIILWNPLQYLTSTPSVWPADPESVFTCVCVYDSLFDRPINKQTAMSRVISEALHQVQACCAFRYSAHGERHRFIMHVYERHQTDCGRGMWAESGSVLFYKCPHEHVSYKTTVQPHCSRQLETQWWRQYGGECNDTARCNKVMGDNMSAKYQRLLWFHIAQQKCS